MRILLLLTTLVVAGTRAAAEAPESAREQVAGPPVLSVGDAAPALSVETWLRGDPIPRLEPGQVYLLDVWATWCGPCIQSAPHLSELQARHAQRGLHVIGLTAADKRGNSRRAVEALLTDKPDLMRYAIAWDKERNTTNAYLGAAKRTSIPTAFLIDRAGKIAFIGHPNEVDAVLEQVLDGKHDLARLRTEHEKRAAEDVRAEELRREYSAALKKRDWPKLAEIADQLLAIDARKYGVMAAMKFRILVREVGDCDRGYAFARAHFAGPGKDDWMAMAAVAFEIVDPGSKIPRRDLDLAIELCTKANGLSGGDQVTVLEAWARAHYLKGELPQAIEIAERAAKLDPNLVDTLERYKAELAGK